jgi:hypothetical protein
MRVLLLSKIVGVACVAVVGMGAGCGCPVGSRQAQPTCHVTGGATLSSPAELAFGQTMYAQGGRNCLAEDGSCSREPQISVTSRADGSGPPLFMALVNLPAAPSGTFNLTTSSGACVPPDSNCVSVTSLAVTSSGGVDVTFVSGTVDLQRSTTTNLDAAFTLAFQAPDGQAISVSDGHVSMTGCQVEQVCAE